MHAQDCGIVVFDNKNKARWVLLNILAKKPLKSERFNKTAENFAERSKTNVFIWRKSSRVFF